MLLSVSQMKAKAKLDRFIQVSGLFNKHTLKDKRNGFDFSFQMSFHLFSLILALQVIMWLLVITCIFFLNVKYQIITLDVYKVDFAFNYKIVIKNIKVSLTLNQH